MGPDMETDSALAFLSRLVMFVVLLVLSVVFLVLVFRLAAIVLETMVRLFSPWPKGVISSSRIKAETDAEIKSDMERINSLSVEEAEGGAARVSVADACGVMDFRPRSGIERVTFQARSGHAGFLGDAKEDNFCGELRVIFH
jgi:hypothetical protein